MVFLQLPERCVQGVDFCVLLRKLLSSFLYFRRLFHALRCDGGEAPLGRGGVRGTSHTNLLLQTAPAPAHLQADDLSFDISGCPSGGVRGGQIAQRRPVLHAAQQLPRDSTLKCFWGIYAPSCLISRIEPPVCPCTSSKSH